MADYVPDTREEIVAAHVGNVSGREAPCSFYYEVEGVERCRLEDFFKREGDFSPEEAKDLCGFRHARRKTRCSYFGNAPKKDNGELVVENGYLRKQLDAVRGTLFATRADLADALGELKAYRDSK
jgi:hypothetical protein